MNIDEQKIRDIAHLARLKVEDEHLPALKLEMEQILSWMQKLDEVDTAGVEPLIHVSPEVDRLRDDVAQRTLSKKDALENVPVKDTDYIRVPKVIE